MSPARAVCNGDGRHDTMKFLLHIGHHKTATLFLQREVFPHHPHMHFVPPPETKDVFLRTGSFHFEGARHWREKGVAAGTRRAIGVWPPC